MASEESLTFLRQRRRNNTHYNLRMTAELWAILGLFAANDIQAVPFKGPTLAALAGDDLSWRSFGDLDLLLDRRDVAAASNLLRSRGYELNLDWEATQDARFLDVTYALEFFGGPSGVMVELHWALFPRYMGFDFEFAELRQRLTPVSPGGKPMQTLALDDLLLYLCAHGAKHFWTHLNGVVDVGRLIASRDDWQWEALLGLARKRNVERATMLGLLLAQGLLGAPVPKWVVEQAAQDKSLMRLAEATVAEMFFPKQQDGGMQRQFRYFLQLQQGWRARLLYLLRLVVAPNVGDWEFQPLPHQWAFLYVVLRPLRLMKKYLNS